MSPRFVSACVLQYGGYPVQQLCHLVGEIVTAAFGVAAHEMRASSGRPAPVAFARQAAIYLGQVVFGLSLTRLARHACRIVEERPDDPVVDRFLGALEALCCDVMAIWNAGGTVRS